MASWKPHKCFSVCGRLPQSASLTVLVEGDELESWMLEQPVKINGWAGSNYLNKL